MASVLKNKKVQLPAYEEYDAFFKKNSSGGSQFQDYEHYLKQYSFFKTMMDVLPGAIYILNFETQQYLLVSESCQSILGYTSKEMMKKGRKFMLSNIHPEDMHLYKGLPFKQFLEFTQQLTGGEIKKCRFSTNYRFKRKDGAYIKILQQYVILEVNDKGYPLLSLGMVTDITAHKPDNKMIFSISKYNKGKGFEIISSESYPRNLIAVSKREHEIVKHLILGQSSKMIADKLKISVNTVHNHRQSIFKKTNSRNIAQLIAYATTNNLV